MKNILYTFTILLLALFLVQSCKETDNYVAPNATLKGTVTSSITKQPVEVELNNGTAVQLFEINPKYPNPAGQKIPIQENGNYENSKLFSGQYKLLFVDGPFFPIDTQRVTISGTTVLNYVLTPYISIDASTTVSAGTANVTYKLTKGDGPVQTKIQEARVLVSSIPTVNTTVFDQITTPVAINRSYTNTLTSTSDAVITATNYTFSVTGLTSGRTYYIRVGARVANGAGLNASRFNYSSVMKVIIP